MFGIMKVALFGKTIAPNDIPYVQEFIDRLDVLKGQVYIYEPFYVAIHDKIRFTSMPLSFSLSGEIMGKVEYLFSIGGDGTMLDAIPLVGNSPASIAATYSNTATVDWAPVNSAVTGDVVYVGQGCPAGSISTGSSGRV